MDTVHRILLSSVDIHRMPLLCVFSSGMVGRFVWEHLCIPMEEMVEQQQLDDILAA